MDGKDLLRRLEQILNEESTGTWTDDKSSYDFLWEAAKEWVARTKSLTATQEFITVAGQPNYMLDVNFLKLFLTDNSNRYFLKYTDGSDHLIRFMDYEDILHRNSIKTYDIQQATLTTAATTIQDTGQDFSDWETSSGDSAYKLTITNTQGTESWAYLGEASTTTNDDDTVAVFTDLARDSTGWNGAGTPSGTASFYRVEKCSTQDVPDGFAIRDKQTKATQSTGTATSDGAAAGGECTLTDTSAEFFSSEYVEPGDVAHNTTDASDGIVLSITSDTALVCALFNGTDNEWDTDDAYVIQPQGRLEIFLDPPPATAGHIVRVDFISRPDPVYSDYGIYRFRQHAMEAIVKYAAWLYKYRDQEPNFGDVLYQWFDKAVRQEAFNLHPEKKRARWTVNLKARR